MMAMRSADEVDLIRETLRAFCGDEDARYAISHPWRDGSWVYATNGAVCLRSPVMMECEAPKYKTPPVSDLPWDALYESSVAIECCDPLKECERCHATGMLTCDLLHEHDCPDCDGQGFLAYSVKIGGIPFASSYLHEFAKRGGRLQRPVVNPQTSPHRVTMYDGDIEGLLMPRWSEDGA